MNRKVKLIIASLGMLAVPTGCSQMTAVNSADLTQVVQRDAVTFSVHSVPDAVLDRLSQHEVVLVGETHFLREHREMMVELVRGLHSRGFRQILMEWPQMADWLLADFVLDGGLLPGWEPPLSLGGDMIAAIRDFNRTLPDGERVQVRGIDVNLDDYGGATDFRNLLGALAKHLVPPSPLTAFLNAAYDTPGRQHLALESLQAGLQAGRTELAAAWGAERYNMVVEMVEVELASVSIRATRESDYDRSVRVRENVMKDIVDRRLADYAYGTLINVGGNHAQKSYLKGTEQQWLGDYLVHESAAAAGSVIVLVVTAARITSAPGSAIPDYDLSASPENELFRTMNEMWPGQVVLLPADDPLFLSGVRMNFEGAIYVGAPKRIYDVYLLLPSAHRVPLP